jgi:tRNA pseudouridine38-40 synthase
MADSVSSGDRDWFRLTLGYLEPNPSDGSKTGLPVWKLTIEYEGTRYHGWQEQRGYRTVAGEIRTAAEKVFEARVDLAGSGRTDSGVHALAQVARLAAPRRIKPVEVRRLINDQLPADINLLKVDHADERFDPRRDAIARYYIYQISTRRTAFAKRFVWWVRDPLDVETMTGAASVLVGRHDFEALSERRGDDRSTIVVVERAEVAIAGDLILFRLGASHFLWKMVRRIVGVLVEVGRGKAPPSSLQTLIASRNRRDEKTVSKVAASTAPPSGLFLERVIYSGQAPPEDLAPVVPVWAPRR